MSKKQYLTSLALIVVLAWGLRLGVTAWFVGLSSPPDAADGLDQLDYEEFAYNLSRGAGYTFNDGTPTARRPPGTSLLLAPVYWCFGRSFLAARLVITFLSALTCAAAASIARRALGPVAALVTAAVVAVNPCIFYYSVHIWSEAPYLLLMTWATGASVAAIQTNDWRRGIGAGLLWGATVLVRPQVVFLLPVALLVAVASPSTVRRKALTQFAWQAMAMLLLVSPWIARNAVVMGKPALSTLVGGYTFLGAHNDETFFNPEFKGRWVGGASVMLDDSRGRAFASDRALTEIEQEDLIWQQGWKNVRQHWLHMPELLLWKMYYLLTPFESTANRAAYWAFALTWILTVPWIYRGWREIYVRSPELAAMIAIETGATVCCALFFYGGLRFRHLLEPLIMIVAVSGVSSYMAEALRRSRFHVASTCRENDDLNALRAARTSPVGVTSVNNRETDSSIVALCATTTTDVNHESVF